MEKLWTTAEVARYLGIGDRDVERLVEEGQLTGYRLGGEFIRFKPEQVKGLKGRLEPGQQLGVGAGEEPARWLDRAREFLYAYDFYLVSTLLLMGVIIYLLATA